MEFTKKTFQIRRLDRQLDGKDLLDADEVKKFQRRVCDEESRSREERFRELHPFKHAATKPFCMVVVGMFLPAAIIVAGSILKKDLVLLTGLAILITLSLGLIVNKQRTLSKIQGRSWELSPFSAFEDEYKGEVAAQVEPSILSRQGNYLLRLGVEHHHISDVRFLVVSDPEDEWSESVYIDYWEKPDPPYSAQIHRLAVPKIIPD